jgi:serine/threonine protein kinase
MGSDLTERVPRDERLAAVLDRYMTELERTGVPPDVDRLVAQHPDLADELRSYVDSLQVLHQMTAGLRPADRSSGGTSTTGSKRLGDYEIVREIGRGGMGVVYEARQLSLNRQVALKVLPFAAMLDERQIARFRTEAQAAAQLHHGNIVPVYAVGQERGVHYFAMQLIAGQSLELAIRELRGAQSSNERQMEVRHAHADVSTAPTVGNRQTPEGEAPEPKTRVPVSRLGGSLALPARADRETVVESAFSTRVSTRSRTYCHSMARLVLQAAEALHHAHQLGVIHRDVKPSNLLLDRDGRLWVTDFGLARMQTDAGVTISGDIVGTVRYMSPEQAAGTPALVDARTDVYSLGATLYELLTLQPAHRGESRAEILRNIESVEPASPRSLNPSTPFDLETITLRALAKARDERYSTAQELADDLRRFLNGEPTHARRPTLLDRASKWALRHRRSVALAGAFLVVLTIVSAAAAVLVFREKGRTDAALLEAKHNLDRANEHYQQAIELVDQFGEVANNLATYPGTEEMRQGILGQMLGYYQAFIRREASSLQLNQELALAYQKGAIIAERLGQRQQALAMCREALKLFDSLAASSSHDANLQIRRADTFSTLGLLLANDGEGEKALAAHDKAIRILNVIAKREAGAGEAEQSLAECYSNRGLLEAQLGDKEHARASLQSSISLLQDLLASNPTDSALRHSLAIGFNNLSYIQRESDWAGAEKSCREGIKILERLVGDNGEKPSYRSDLALCENNLGAILGHRGEWREACSSYQRAIEAQRQLVRQAGAVVSYRRDLAVGLNNLGQAQQELGELPAAIGSFNEAGEVVGQLVEDYPNDATYRSLSGAVLNNRGMALEASQEYPAALAAYEKAIENQRAAHEKAPGVAEFREFLSKHYFNYGRTLRAAGRPSDAAAAALERRKLWSEDGEHLGQVALELAEAAAQLREAGGGEGGQEAARIEDEVKQTLQTAAEHGRDLKALLEAKPLAFLHNDAIWANLDTHMDAQVP